MKRDLIQKQFKYISKDERFDCFHVTWDDDRHGQWNAAPLEVTFRLANWTGAPVHLIYGEYRNRFHLQAKMRVEYRMNSNPDAVDVKHVTCLVTIPILACSMMIIRIRGLLALLPTLQKGTRIITDAKSMRHFTRRRDTVTARLSGDCIKSMFCNLCCMPMPMEQ